MISVHDPDLIVELVSLLSLSGNESLLDVGTGTGVMIPYYSERLNRGNITAMDYSEKMLEVAERKFPSSDRLRYVTMDVYELDEQNRYDVIVCYSCFPHFPNKSDAVRILSGALNENGTLMIAHGISRRHVNNVHRECDAIISNDLLPEMNAVAKMFKECGLSVTYTRDDERTFTIIGKKGSE